MQRGSKFARLGSTSRRALVIRIHFRASTWDAIFDSIGQRSWSGLPKSGIIQSEVADVRESGHEKSSPIRPTSLAVEIHVPIHHIRHVASFTEELHHLLASACHLCPRGFRFRVLFQPTYLVPIENEVHLAQTVLRSQPDRVTLCAYDDELGVLDESLPPDLDEVEQWLDENRRL